MSGNRIKALTEALMQVWAAHGLNPIEQRPGTAEEFAALYDAQKAWEASATERANPGDWKPGACWSEPEQQIARARAEEGYVIGAVGAAAESSPAAGVDPTRAADNTYICSDCGGEHGEHTTICSQRAYPPWLITFAREEGRREALTEEISEEEVEAALDVWCTGSQVWKSEDGRHRPRMRAAITTFLRVRRGG